MLKKRIGRVLFEAINYNPLINGVRMKKLVKQLAVFCSLIFVCLSLTSCDESKAIISGVNEREANIIVVFLDSKGIIAYKEKMATSPGATGEAAAPKYNIIVGGDHSIEAMALLNSNGLPQRQGTTLLELFAKQGLMSTDKEETVRYQAGLAQQVTNMILMIDGVIDASVQLSFPQADPGAEEQEKEVVTAAVFVKHQGIIDDPNSHLENKIKRLVSGSVNGLDISNVTIVSDRSRFTDISASSLPQSLDRAGMEYVRIWSMVMSKESASKFRFVFFLLLVLALVLALMIGWLLWKMYPTLKSKGGFNELLNPIPMFKKKKDEGNVGEIPPGPPSEPNEPPPSM